MVESRVEGGRWRRWGPSVRVPFFDLGRREGGMVSPGKRTVGEAMLSDFVERDGMRRAGCDVFRERNVVSAG